jgi:hypothetical protein
MRDRLSIGVAALDFLPVFDFLSAVDLGFGLVLALE